MFEKVRERTKQEDRPVTDIVLNSLAGYRSNMRRLRSISQDANSWVAILGDRDQDQVRSNGLVKARARCT
jgi:hypothetical protein